MRMNLAKGLLAACFMREVDESEAGFCIREDESTTGRVVSARRMSVLPASFRFAIVILSSSLAMQFPCRNNLQEPHVCVLLLLASHHHAIDRKQDLASHNR
jgi:hypothetical protein